jgi:acetyl esterase/lipase
MTSRTAIIVRLVVWTGLAAGVVWLGVHSRQPAAFDPVAAYGVRFIKRSVDRDPGTTHHTPLEIYLPPPGAVWEPVSSARVLPSAGIGGFAESGQSSPGAVAPARRRRPAVIAIHGGSWTGGSPRLYRLDPESTALRLAGAGLVVVAPQYRLARPGEPSWPAVLDELREVVRWVRRHASELDIAPDKIAALGQSSGGQLAVLLGTMPDQPGPDGVSARVDAVIDFYGPSDLAALVEKRHLAHEPVRVYLRERAADNPLTLREASPITHVTSDDAPMLLVHGSDDAWVPPQQSTKLADSLRRAGVKHKMILVDGVQHGFEARVKTPRERDLLPEILAFLRDVWTRR